MSDRTTAARGRVRALAMGLTTASAIGVLAGTAAAGDEPQHVDGNPRCPAGTTGLKIEPVKSGVYTDGALRVSLDVNASAKTVSFRSNIGLDKVIVKGGPAANIYAYAKGTSGTGLHAPVNASGGWAGLSHVDFCYGGAVEQPPAEQPPREQPPSEQPPAGQPPSEQPPSEQPPAEQPQHTDAPPAEAYAAPSVAAAQTPPRAGVSAIRVGSGRAVLARLPRCATNRYRLTVRGRAMRGVAVYVNGHKVRTVRVARGRTSVTVTLARVGRVQRVRARVTFDASSRTRPRDLRMTILPCAPGSARPTFTG
jgi:hypothetical protein